MACWYRLPAAELMLLAANIMASAITLVRAFHRSHWLFLAKSSICYSASSIATMLFELLSTINLDVLASYGIVGAKEHRLHSLLQILHRFFPCYLVL